MNAPPSIASSAVAAPIPFEARRAARSLYWRGWAIGQIAEELGLAISTVSSWKNRHGWDKAKINDKIEDGLEARYLTLIAKEDKSGKDFKEIDLLGRQITEAERRRKYSESGRESDLNPKRANGASPEAKAKAKATRDEKNRNFLTEEQWQDLLDDFHDKNFDYQELWWSKRGERNRKIRKSRQVGATWYFAREAMAKIGEAVLAGEQPNNQIFLSASQRQANKFRREIVSWVRRVTGVQLTGNPIMLDLGPDLDQVGLYPLSTNSATAQGESGDFYMDEYAWVQGFATLKKVASGMATHKIYKKTYFSSASVKTHESYAFWSGEEWNKGKPREKQQEFDLSLANLRNGNTMPDGSWQHMLTIHDACQSGLGKLIDIDELRQEYSEDEFRNLDECEDIDDSESSFPYAVLNRCRVDSFYKWPDFKPAEPRPFGNKRVWLGYDPDKGGRDGAALVVIAPPDKPGGKFRLLEKISLKGMDFEAQAKAIRRTSKRYNVEDIGIDTSGAGQAVWELVVKWFRTARRIDYTVANKAALVMKAQNVIRNGRFEYDAGWNDVTSAFIAIHPALTKGQKYVTYVSGRSTVHGHADVAWAVMNALINEPMDAGEGGTKRARVEFSE